MGCKKHKDSSAIDKRTSKPDIIHEDEMRKHKSKGVIKNTKGTI